ncbi:uncharacterized protein LOC117657513 [Pantherophis guttatus]|uniref:Uncharacterized protein LOC117657513 n=1 Tax=Pantherophis guttatus TaxID=94885 RepID=A0ABM3ZMI7_PANGU|nr:uncharacterized protein LOC117657513 [Pantherophis guttatus]
MFARRGVYWLPPCSPGDNVRRPAGNPVVLTSVNMSWNLQITQPQSQLSLVLEDQTSVGNDRLAEAGSPTDAVPHQLGFLPMSGRLLKSESEDSGVELASGDHVPLTPVESEKSFSLDCLDGDDSVPAIQEGCPQERPEALLPIVDSAWQDFCVKRKLGDVVQRFQKNLVPMPKKPSPDLEELKSCHYPCEPVSVEVVLDEATSDSSTLEEKTKEEVSVGKIHNSRHPIPCQDRVSAPWRTSPKLWKKMAKLQKANKEIQHEQQVLECRIRTLESRVCTLGQEKCVNPVSVDGVLDEASGGCSQATSGGRILEEEKTKEEAQQPASRSMPGPGLHYLENLSKIMEKMVKLQKANLEIHHKCQILECQIRILEQEKNDRSLWGRLKGLFRMRRKSGQPKEVIQVTMTRNTSSDTTSQSQHR